MDDCLFCKIATKQIPSAIVYEDDGILAFNDIAPQAPTHVLIIPKTHIESTSEIDQSNKGIAADIIAAASKIARDLNLEGHRLVFNSGEIAGQSVFHLHCHLLGGRAMKWPPG
ncbi:MAG: histidine triad nucleotide-binding protein [Chlorobi bacterium]|nr:histidine triad nucleotide-binding protein [Chlorobiota bacterium]MCI0714815.1 histidine triad nucleotide-binding protein [Chlorobiota bacterium]